jgi:hypothetical protein
MTSKHIWPHGLAVALACILAFLGAVGLAVAEIIEGPDPVGANSSGDDEDDRAADTIEGSWSKGPDTGGRRAAGENAPCRVWAKDMGGDHDIAFSDERGASWRERASFLTSSPADEVDPRAFEDADGTVYVVWWENETPQSVLLARRPAGSDAWEAALVVSQDGRHPDVAALDDEVFVAFERSGLAGGTELVVATLGPDGRSFETVAFRADGGSFAPTLEAEAGRVTLAWRDGEDDVLVVAERVGGGRWSAPLVALETEP